MCRLGRPACRVVYYYGKDRVDVRELLTRWRKRVALSLVDGSRSSGGGSKGRSKMPPGYVPPPVDGDRGFDKLRAMQDSDEEAAEDEEALFGYEVSWVDHCKCRGSQEVWGVSGSQCFASLLRNSWRHLTLFSDVWYPSLVETLRQVS